MPSSPLLFEDTCSHPAWVVLGLGLIFTLSVSIHSIRRRRWPLAVFFGIWALYIPIITFCVVRWPDTLRITDDRIEGRHDFTDFHVPGADLEKVLCFRQQRGAPTLRLYRRNSPDPTIAPLPGDRLPELRSALTRFRATHHATLDWPADLK